MATYPVIKLEACVYDDLPSNTAVLNADTLEYVTWIHLPEALSKYIELFQIDELLPYSGEVSWLQYVQRDSCRPWISIKSDFLNMSIGQHIYKLGFINKHTNDIISLYISYILQSDHPSKPYIYMRRGEKATIDLDCSNSSERYETSV